MAEASYRFQQSGPNQVYFLQQNNQQNYHQRNATRNGSPVNNTRGGFGDQIPSPSRSPVSHNAYGYTQNQNPGQQPANHGPPHQRYVQAGGPLKYQPQAYPQHHTQPNHHRHQTNHLGGHPHTHSTTSLNTTPHFTPRNLHNGTSSHNNLGLADEYPAHWHHQLQLYNESKQVQQSPHHHCKKDGVISKVDPASELKRDAIEDERLSVVKSGEVRRQDWDSLDCSGQGIRILTRPLFSHYMFLKKLYLDHNCLVHLDPMIGQLKALDHLDLSNNKIRSIPGEIGVLVNLKTLLLFDNHLQRLPFEIGHLFKLEMLGLEGNPIDGPEKDFLMTNGTRALITQFREEAPVADPPHARDWLEIDSSATSENLSVVSYNILGNQYATTSHYGYSASRILSWPYRREIILEEIRGHDADVVCLQEIDRENYDNFFRRELALNDYRGVYWPRSRAKTMAEKDAKLVDGCAIFFKASKFLCLDKQLIDFGSIAINRPDMKGEHDTFNRVMPRDHIAIIVFLENRMTGSRMMVANAHIYWDPAFVDVKLVQVAILMEQITLYADKWAKMPPSTDKAPFRHSEIDSEAKSDATGQVPVEPGPSQEYDSGPQIPLIICGDFNAAAGTGVYELIANGQVPGNHGDLVGRGYGKFTRDGIHHPFRLKSAYGAIGELRFTNYTPDFDGVVDYIWYSTNAMEVKGLLGNIDEQYLRKVPGFPNQHFPSDHLALKAELAIKPRKGKRPVDANHEGDDGG